MIEKILEKIQELIDESFSNSLKGYTFASARNGAYQEVKKIVKEVAEEYKSTEYINCSTNDSTCGWIPCSERLPEEIVKDCLVTLENGAVFQAQYVKYYKEFRIVAPYHGIIRFHEDNPVIAWTELPVPYQG